MWSRLLGCPRCARHVRVSERRCPFCEMDLPETFGTEPAPRAPPRGISRSALYRHGALAAATAVAGSAAISLGGGAACTETLAQPDDAGPFVVYEGGHPVATMYGSPCELDQQPERCCGEVTKEIPAAFCYGCAGKVAYALCTGEAFTCACTCEFPMGYSLITPDGGSSDCGTAASDAGSGDSPAEAEPEETGPADASPDASMDAEAGASGVALEGG